MRSGRYGPYLVHGDERVSIPEATEPDSLTVEHALELLAAPSNDRELGLDEHGDTIFLKAGRYGPYVQVGEMTDPKEKPKTASLLSTMSPETVTLEDAKRLLRCPRHVGEHPEGGEILAQNGRYGPYLTWGKETRSLEDESQIFSVDLDRALALFAQPKQRGRRAAAKPLAELGEDPVTKREVVVRSGRFGLYVTDGETNATLRIGDTPETITPRSSVRAPGRTTQRRTLDAGAQGHQKGDQGDEDHEAAETQDHKKAPSQRRRRPSRRRPAPPNARRSPKAPRQTRRCFAKRAERTRVERTRRLSRL